MLSLSLVIFLGNLCYQSLFTCQQGNFTGLSKSNVFSVSSTFSSLLFVALVYSYLIIFLWYHHFALLFSINALLYSLVLKDHITLPKYFQNHKFTDISFNTLLCMPEHPFLHLLLWNFITKLSSCTIVKPMLLHSQYRAIRNLSVTSDHLPH